MPARYAAELTATGRSTSMAGDFNATPWPAGLWVVQDAVLVRATSLGPTWSAHLPAPAALPIDHITGPGTGHPVERPGPGHQRGPLPRGSDSLLEAATKKRCRSSVSKPLTERGFSVMDR